MQLHSLSRRLEAVPWLQFRTKQVLHRCISLIASVLEMTTFSCWKCNKEGLVVFYKQCELLGFAHFQTQTVFPRLSPYVSQCPWIMGLRLVPSLCQANCWLARRRIPGSCEVGLFPTTLPGMGAVGGTLAMTLRSSRDFLEARSLFYYKSLLQNFL